MISPQDLISLVVRPSMPHDFEGDRPLMRHDTSDVSISCKQRLSALSLSLISGLFVMTISFCSFGPTLTKWSFKILAIPLGSVHSCIFEILLFVFFVGHNVLINFHIRLLSPLHSSKASYIYCLFNTRFILETSL